MTKSRFNLIGTALLGLMIGVAVAQAIDSVPAVPDLSFSERAGLQKVASEFSQAQADLKALSIDIAKNHPGYILGPNGTLVESKPATAPIPAKPATAPATKK
jgi:hypothetical protein